MSDKPKNPSWILIFMLMGATCGMLVFWWLFGPAKTLVPSVPSGGGHNAEHKAPPPQRLQVVAKNALLIAIDEVKKREGWSSNPDWANVEFGEAGVWEVTVRRTPRSSVGERHVFVTSGTGEVVRYY
jgi:hypothetical protein